MLKISPEKVTVPATVSTTSLTTTKPTAKSPVTSESTQDPKLHFCRHCDVLVVGEGVRKTPTGSSDKNVVFCSSACYLQHTISQRAQIARTEAQAGRVVNHRSSDPQASQLIVTSPKTSASMPTSPCTAPKTPPQSKSLPISPRSQPAQLMITSPIAAQPASATSEEKAAAPTSNQEVSPAKEEKEAMETEEAKGDGEASGENRPEGGREELRLTLKTGTRRRTAFGDDVVRMYHQLRARRVLSIQQCSVENQKGAIAVQSLWR